MSDEESRELAVEYLATKFDFSNRHMGMRGVEICVPLPAQPTGRVADMHVHMDSHRFDVYDVIELLQRERRTNHQLQQRLCRLETMLIVTTEEMRDIINGKDRT